MQRLRKFGEALQSRREMASGRVAGRSFFFSLFQWCCVVWYVQHSCQGRNHWILWQGAVQLPHITDNHVQNGIKKNKNNFFLKVHDWNLTCTRRLPIQWHKHSINQRTLCFHSAKTFYSQYLHRHSSQPQTTGWGSSEVSAQMFGFQCDGHRPTAWAFRNTSIQSCRVGGASSGVWGS